ncbi:MAG: phosphoenolpyruvate carboxykinase domain-containing protein, partial [Thermaceae bacterium]|nr:phosphoenolpyruvate carboxykinase domain-containing protein [Thermaceae bacterium]
ESPLGYVPHYEDLDWRGREFSKEQFQELMTIDRDLWLQEILSHEALFIKLYDRMPKEFLAMRELLISNLWRSPEQWDLATNSVDS